MDGLRRLGWTALMALVGGVLHGNPADDTSLAARAARIVSPEMRRTEARFGQIDEELENLPELRDAVFVSRYGFRSETLFEQDKPQWVQIDLKRSWPIDRIAAVPVRIPSIGKSGEGYGFPLRFRIEVADNPEMKGAVTVADHTGEDVANPGRYPMVFRIEPVEARYVRFTSTRHFPVDVGFVWAMEELVVLSGNNSISIRADPTASSVLELFPNWSIFRIVDGQSSLGMPTTREPSPTQGYASAVTGDPNEPKWIEVDLGREYPVDEVCFSPVESATFEMLGSKSFPRGWKVEVSNDPDYKDSQVLLDQPRTNLPGYPGKCALVVPGLGIRGRYVRLVSSGLWGGDERWGFAVAEIQIYSGNENVALGKPVRVKDTIELSESSGWSPAFVVDGFTSLHRLIEYPHYLDLIERRGKLVMEQNRLVTLRDGKVRSCVWVLGYSGGGLVLAATLGSMWLVIRQRSLRSGALAQLRDQIARDLHDDIGSNLGGIVLLSEMGSRHANDPQAREDFSAIKEAAEGTSQSMQDIVWLIERGNMGLRDLVGRMRRSVEVILVDTDVSLTVAPLDFRDRDLSLFFRRHVFFAFKETLNNIRKHAGTETVGIQISIDSRELVFEVRDEGAGFDLHQVPVSGHGLANLRRRAERLQGLCNVESRPGHGTRVFFKAPFKSDPK